MKNAGWIFALSLMVSVASAAPHSLDFGSSSQPEEVSVALTAAYVPGGFDSNDTAQIVVEGSFPNTCYRVGNAEKTVNPETKDIVITQKAYKYRGPCLLMTVPFIQTVPLGLLKEQTYKIKDGEGGRELGALPVAEALNDGPDDHLYAGVTDAYVQHPEGADKKIVIRGELPNACWAIEQTRVILDGEKVVTVLPILAKTHDGPCADVRVPFTKTFDAPKVTSGRYLLHVRSLNGVAVNRLVDL